MLQNLLTSYDYIKAGQFTASNPDAGKLTVDRTEQTNINSIGNTV